MIEEKVPKVLNKWTHEIPPDAVYVGRPTKWENPYRTTTLKWKLGIPVGRGKDPFLSRQEAIDLYEWRLCSTEIGATLMTQIEELRGRDLVCWCAPLPCHADVLLKLANRPMEKL